MRKRRIINYFNSTMPGLLVAILIFISALPAGDAFVYAENDIADSVSSEGTLTIGEVTLPIDPETPETIPDIDPKDSQDPPPEELLPGEELIVSNEDAGADIEQMPTTSNPYSNVDVTIDLSEAHNVNLLSSWGYEIKWLDSQGLTYSYFKPSLRNYTLTDPAYTSGRLDFGPNASNKTFRLIQTGTRTENSKLTKNGTIIVPVIVVQPNVNNLTLILEDIDLGQYAMNDLHGYININAGSSVTFLLGTDAGNPSIGSSYSRTTVHVTYGASLTIDSFDSPGSSSGTLTVTPSSADAAAIGGSSAANGQASGQITINGGTVNATQNMANTTGAAIGGGRVSTTGAVGAGYVTINGGTVNATASGRGAAIGGSGSTAFNSTAGAGHVSINGGVVNATNTGYGAAIGGGAALFSDYSTGPFGHAGACNISITGGVVTATANKGAAIGSGYIGHQGLLSDNRIIGIGSGATVKAYSSGDNIPPTGQPGFARPAIDVWSLSDNGHFVNAILDNASRKNFPTKLDIRYNGGGPVRDSLTLPANYRNFAYSTGVSRTDNIIVYNATNSSLIGGVKHDDADESFEIFSVNTTTGYAAHGDTVNALLPVKLDPNSAPFPKRYHVYSGTLEPSSFVTTRHLLADAVAQCSSNNTPYTIIATEHDANMTDGGGNAITIAPNKIIKLTSDKAAPGSAWAITTQSAARHFHVQGSLTLEDIVLDGGNVGGGLYVTGMAAMNSGAAIQNSRADKGGAVYVDGGSFAMAGTAKLNGNQALSGPGGGIYTAAYADINIGPGALFGGNTSPAGMDLGLSQAVYSLIFPTIYSPYGPYYSTASNHPVNNHDINVLQYTVTVHYIDDNGDPLFAPAPVSDVSMTYQAAAGLPFELDGSAGRIIPDIDDYDYVDWAVGSPSDTIGDLNVSLENVTGNTDIYLRYERILFTSVTVSNTVKGKYADKTKAFLFTVYYYADKYDAEPMTPGGEHIFSLAHGQKIILEEVPADVYIRIVTEEALGYYTPSFWDSIDADSTIGNDTDLRLTGTKPRTFDFLNTAGSIVPSGVRDSYRDPAAPLYFAALLLISALAVTVRIRRRLLET